MFTHPHRKYAALLLCAVLLLTTLAAGLTGCTKGGTPSSSEGLEMKLNPDGKGYTCTGVGTCTDTEIVIDTYEGLPVTAIGIGALYGQAGITEITLGAHVASVERLALACCTSLTKITVDEDNEAYASIDGNLYSKDGKTLVQYAVGKSDTSFTFPDKVKWVADAALSGCTSLQRLHLPAGTTSLGGQVLRGCTSLLEITVDPDNPNYVSVDGNLYSKGGEMLLQYAIGKADKSYSLPDGIVKIADFAFYGCENLTSVTLCDTLKAIGREAFYGCQGLTSMTLPKNLLSVGSYAFYGCNGMTSVTLGGKLVSVDAYAFHGCDALTEVHATDLAAWCGISFADSSANPLHIARKLFVDGREVTSLTLPDGVTKIGQYAFYSYEGLTSLTLPASVKSLGAYSLSGCVNLTDVYFGGSEEEWNALNGLAAAYIPEGVNLHFDHQP